MNKKNVLIFPSGSEGALNIFDSLKYNLHFELFGCSAKRNYTEYIFPEGNFYYSDERMYINHPQFVEALMEVLQKFKIDYIIPTFDDVALKLTEVAPNLCAKIVTSPYSTALVASDKRKMYNLIKDYSFAPEVFLNETEVTVYPVFAKPAVGCGSQNVKKLINQSEVKECLEKDMVVCEYLSGEEVTVDCFTDRHGVLRFAGARSRERIWHGITFRGNNLSNSEEIDYIAKTLNGLLSFRGAWFFQLKRNDAGQFKLLEFSVRQSTNSSLYGKLGVNFSALSLFDAMDLDVNILCNQVDIQQECRIKTSYRLAYCYDTVYIDFDDTLTNCDKVNLNMIKLLYQFINKDKRVVLITRHEGDLYQELKKFKISSDLFDEVIWIRDNTLKSEYVVEKHAIFIDNYFKERLAVSQKCGIPVFDVDAAEALLEDV